MGKEVKAAFGLVVLSNLAMIDAFVAIQEVLSEDQSKVLLEALDRVKTTNQELMELAGFKGRTKQ
jgi:hypothetical protein